MRGFLKKIIALFQKLQICLVTRRKITRITGSIKRTPRKEWKPSKDLVKSHKYLWNKYLFNVNLKWLKVYGTLSGIQDYKYIPEDVYYSEVEPRLNNKAFSKAYTDKNFYHYFLDHSILPEVVLRSINGVFYDNSYSALGKGFDAESIGIGLTDIKYVIKPTLDTGGGEGIKVISILSGGVNINPAMPGVDSITNLIKSYKRDFLIQRYIEQHSFFEQFNYSSLNTIRILTYRSFKNEEIVILHCILRIGKKGSVVDNQASGGIACGIKPDGILSDFGVDKYGNKYFSSNGIIFSSVGEVPFLTQIADVAKQIAQRFVYSRLLGMDFGVDKNGKIFLIEVNDSNNEINFYQMNNGPLFGDYTEEVAFLSILEPKSFVIDYNLY